MHQSIRDEFIERFSKRASELYQPGDPLDPTNSLGPMVSRAHQQDMLGWVEKGQSEGACLEFGGTDDQSRPGSAYLLPTLFTCVSPSMQIGREEVFGPVAALFTFRDEAEAVALANDSINGLAASVWTSDATRAHRMVKALKAGVV